MASRIIKKNPHLQFQLKDPNVYKLVKRKDMSLKKLIIRELIPDIEREGFSEEYVLEMFWDRVEEAIKDGALPPKDKHNIALTIHDMNKLMRATYIEDVDN